MGQELPQSFECPIQSNQGSTRKTTTNTNYTSNDMHQGCPFSFVYNPTEDATNYVNL